MTTTYLLRDAYRELDETGSLSRFTQEILLHAGIDIGALEAAHQAHMETEED